MMAGVGSIASPDSRSSGGTRTAPESIRAYKRAAAQLAGVLRGSADGLSMRFRLSAARDEPTRSSLDVGDRVHRNAALLRPFMSPRSPIELRAMWTSLRAELAVGAEAEQTIEQAFERAESLLIAFMVNDQRQTARDVYFAYGEGAYFGDDRDAAARLASWTAAPGPLIEMLFNEACSNYARLALELLDVVLAWERKYGLPSVAPEAPPTCIYCLTDTGDFGPEEHAIPESLVGDSAVLRNAVCRKCNNRLSELDQVLQDSEPIAFLRVVYGPMTKQGKFPRARFRDIDFARTAPRALQVRVKDGRHDPPPQRLEDGTYRFSVSATGRRPFDPVRLARALYKMALGVLALKEGVEVALQPKYDGARAFVLEAVPLPTHLFILTKGKPHGSIRVTTDTEVPGTPVVLDIYGFVTSFSLEGLPVQGMPAELPEEVAGFWLGPSEA